MTVFLVFLFAYALSQFYRSFLAVIAPELARELALSPADLGNISAIWFAAFALAQFPIGVALDRIGPHCNGHLDDGFAVAGACTLAAARSEGAALLAMALIGVGCAAILMGALLVFAHEHRPEHFATLSSWTIGLGSAGNLLAATPLAWAAETMGWHAAFLVIAAVTALSAVFVLAFVRDPAPVVAYERKSTAAELFDIVSLRALWPIFPVALVSYAVVVAECGLWVGSFLDGVYGLDPVERGNVVLLMAAAMSAGALAYGPLDRLFGTRKWVAASGMLVTGIMFLCLARAPASLGVTTAIL